MRKLLLALPILAGVAALSGPAQAAPVAQLARADALAAILATPDTATESVQYYRSPRERFRAREQARRRAEMRQRAEWRRRQAYRRY